MRFLLLVGFFLLLSSCSDEKNIGKVVASVNVKKIVVPNVVVKDMLLNFQEQAKALYSITQIAKTPSSLVSKIKQCRLFPQRKADCSIFIEHLSRAVIAYKSIPKINNSCDSICQLYVIIDKNLHASIESLENLDVIFSTQNNLSSS